MLISTPYSKGLYKRGVATVLSQIVIMPCFLAMAVIASTSAMAICGLDRLSKKIAFVLLSIKGSMLEASSRSKTLA